MREFKAPAEAFRECQCPSSEHGVPKVKIILNPPGKVSHLSCMNEEEIETRFEEIRNELKAQKEQLDAFKEDLKILFKHHSIAPRDILDTAKQLGNAAFDQSDVHRCREFLKKYDLRKVI
jgi:hypothetical protein